MDGERLFGLAYALAARDGRDGALFGGSFPAAQEAFARGFVAGAFPELWFELPLAGEPWFDLHMLVARGDVREGAAYPGLGGAYADALAWFAGGGDARLWCFPAFVKLRWRGGAPPDAKAYLAAGAV